PLSKDSPHHANQENREMAKKAKPKAAAKAKAKPAAKAKPKATPKAAAKAKPAPAKKLQKIPPGSRSVTPHLVVREAANAIEFYKKAFGATELRRAPGPDGKVMHAELQIGDSRVYLNDEVPEMQALSPLALNGTPVTIHLWVEDV